MRSQVKHPSSDGRLTISWTACLIQDASTPKVFLLLCFPVALRLRSRFCPVHVQGEKSGYSQWMMILASLPPTAPLGPAHRARGALGTDIGVDSLAELAQVPEQSHATTCLWALLLEPSQEGGPASSTTPTKPGGCHQRSQWNAAHTSQQPGHRALESNQYTQSNPRHFLACVTLAKALDIS